MPELQHAIRSVEAPSQQPAPPVAVSPDWPREALRSFSGELKLFLSTVWGITRHPVLFGDAWFEGRAKALNPIGFVATTASLLGVAAHLTSLALRTSEPSPRSLLAECLGQLGPFLHFAVAGALLHLLLKLLRGARGRLRDTVALALFVGGGPLAILQLFYFATVLILSRGFHLSGPAISAHPSFDMMSDSGLTSGLSLLAYFLVALFWGWLSGAAEGAHRQSRRGWRMALAVTVVQTALMLFFGLVDPPGNYGARAGLFRNPSAPHGFSIEARFD